MFSLEKFYYILYANLLKPLDGLLWHFEPFGATAPSNLVLTTKPNTISFRFQTLCYDQEPLDIANIKRYEYEGAMLRKIDTNTLDCQSYFYPSIFLLANSEISLEKNQILKQTLWNYDWYYFFHGFAALDWYKNIKYEPPIRTFSKVFITFNNLFEKKRSYRLNLIARMIDKDLLDHGYVSLNNVDTKQKIKEEITSKYSQLSIEAKKLIYKNLLINTPKLIIDIDFSHGNLSASDSLETLSMGLFHIVTETVFYESKLHLTEKIFKPIVAKRPFFLVAAPGNLAYLKRYGFKTFDRWIDESYDLELDPDVRITKIVNEVERLCNLPPQELQTMYEEMYETLDYNFNWFYGGFKEVIVNELIDNFERCLAQHNVGLSYAAINYQSIDFTDVKKRLLQ